MATAVQLRVAWPALSEHRALRFTAIFLLYIAQGLPIGFFHFSLPAWLASNGASAAEVGFVLSAALLPWSLKLFNGFIMDRFAYLAMGRRRAWLIGSQLAIVAGLVLMALRGPNPDEVSLVAAFVFAVSVATTFQDVAVDGMAVDLIPDEERARANGFMFGGQAFGMSIGSFVAGFAMAQYGLSAAALMVGLIVAMLLTLIVVLRERPGERLLPWSPGEASEHARAAHVGAWSPLLRGVARAMFGRTSLMFMAGAFLAGSSYAIFGGVGPLMATSSLGWDEAAFSSLSGTANLIGAIVGVLLVGVIADRVGARRTTVLVLALIGGVALTMLALRDLWSSAALFSFFVIAVLVLNTAMRIGLCAIGMRLCAPTVAATQFCLYMSVSNLGGSAGAALLGVLDGLGGHVAMIAAFAAMNFAAAAWLLMARAGR